MLTLELISKEGKGYGILWPADLPIVLRVMAVELGDYKPYTAIPVEIPLLNRFALDVKAPGYRYFVLASKVYEDGKVFYIEK